MKMLESLEPELNKFFGSESAISLILVGAAGTGKTTFALQILESFKDKYKGIYLSTRVGDKALYQQFPWIKELEEKTKIIDAGRLFLDSLKIAEPEIEPEQVEAARSLVRNIYGEEPKKVSRVLYNKYFKDLNIPELKRIYNEVDSNLPNRTMIVIDSVEGLASKYRINEEELIYTLVKDLVEGGNTNIIFILEKERSDKLEYIADGVIFLEQYLFEGRRIRSLSLDKLRGISTNFKKYLFTLNGGKFTILPPKIVFDMSKHFITSIPPTDRYFSTGVKDLDTILGGGFSFGTFNLIEIGDNVGQEHHFLTMPILSNIGFLDKGLMVVLALGTSIEEVRNRFSIYMNNKTVVDSHAIFIDYSRSGSDKKYIIPIGSASRETSIKLMQEGIAKLKKFGSPLFYYLAFDTIERYRGPVAIQEVVNFVNDIIDSKDIGIGLLLPGSEIKDQIVNMASTHVKVVSINNTLCIYGIEPKTNMYAIEPNDNEFYKFVPIL